jgi:ACS family hexuronate transporter-like MFS transporter
VAIPDRTRASATTARDGASGASAGSSARCCSSRATINYIDRQVLGILAPDLQKEIGWTELDYGRIVIAFQVRTR